MSNLIDLESLNLDGNPLESEALNLNSNSSLAYVSSIDTNLDVIMFKNYTQYTNSNISFGNNIKCIEVDNPSRSRAWDVQWSPGLENNYLSDCSEYLSTANFTIQQIKIINPVKENLIIKGNIKVEKIEIYNRAGQLVKVLFNNNENVSDLAKDSYFVKIITNNKIVTDKIIKE